MFEDDVGGGVGVSSAMSGLLGGDEDVEGEELEDSEDVEGLVGALSWLEGHAPGILYSLCSGLGLRKGAKGLRKCIAIVYGQTFKVV